MLLSSNEGMLYVAPMGSSPPDPVVVDSKFVDDWASCPEWERAGPTKEPDYQVVTNGPFREMTVTVEATSALSAFYRKMNVTLGTSTMTMSAPIAQNLMAMAWESTDRTRRYLFSAAAFRESMMWRGKHATALLKFKFSLEVVPEFWVAGSISNPTIMSMQNYPAARASTSAGKLPPAAAGATGRGSLDLVPGRLRGFREWKLLPSDGLRPDRLGSITADVVWPWTPTIQAHCRRAAIVATGRTAFPAVDPHDPGDVPNVDCSCGIYAKHQPDNIGYHDRVGGVIEAWGRIEAGTEAFRAQYARLVALCTASPFFSGVGVETLNNLGAQYRVPVFHSTADMLAEYPASDISALLGENPPQPDSVRCFRCGKMMVTQVIREPGPMRTIYHCMDCGTFQEMP